MLSASSSSSSTAISGQRRTSPGKFKMQRAAPDLTGEVQRQCAAPDLTGEVQNAVRSAGPYRGAPERTVQRRTSRGGLPSGPCSTGPHPWSSRADRAAPDLSCQKVCQKICQKICQKMSKKCQIIYQKRMSEEMSEDMSKDMSEKNVRKNVRRNVR